MLTAAVSKYAVICSAAEPATALSRETPGTSPEHPVIITAPGPEFQDEARPGDMIIGMDRTPKGRIWGCWTGTGDKPDTYFILATSDDDGNTWSKPRLVVGAPDPTGKPQRRAIVGNLWTDPSGRLWLFFDQSFVGYDGRAGNWVIRCDNPDADRPVWSKPERIADGCTLNKPTVLKNGDWLLPVSLWKRSLINPAKYRQAYKELDPIRMANVYASTDQGKTWSRRGGALVPETDYDEHMIIELRDGRLWMLARTGYGMAETFSSDNGRTWTDPVPAAIKNTNARFFIRRLASGRLLLVKNGPPTERIASRSHMSAFLSDDDGKTWNTGLLLDERGGVSYPDGFQAPDGLIHILYDRDRHGAAEILMAKFREEDVLAGKLVSADAKTKMLVNKATGPKPETLYNGIELPANWPPRYRSPKSAEPMPVPYLEHRPKVVPINIGRQLFVDDFLIEKTSLKRTFHQAKKYEGNPVFKPETTNELAAATEGERGEAAVTFLGQGGVFFDPAEGLFKMFYAAGWRGGLALATSSDMIHWNRPDLGLAGGNLLLPKGIGWSGPQLKTAGSDNCVWLDLNATNSAERIKFLTCWTHADRDKQPKGFSHSLHVSDGKTWSDAATVGPADDYCSFFFNPFRKVWVYSIKRGGARGRARYYAENAEFLKGTNWSKAVYWTNADELDKPEPEGRYPGAGETPQLYSLNAVAYESIMIGMHYIHRGPKNEICGKGQFPKLLDLELGFSRDGFHWDRPDRQGFILGSRTEGSWDRAYLHSTAGMFVLLNDQLVFPYMGTSGTSPSGKHGMYTGGSIGLAMLRRDGFASMDAGVKKGILTTRPVKFNGKYLFINVDAPIGELCVEILDKNEQAIVPFSLENCEPVTADKTLQAVNWKGASDLSSIAGKDVKFRFHLTNGKLYSFWVSPEKSGSSNGYIGAGGPGFKGVQDTSASGDGKTK